MKKYLLWINLWCMIFLLSSCTQTRKNPSGNQPEPHTLSPLNPDSSGAIMKEGTPTSPGQIIPDTTGSDTAKRTSTSGKTPEAAPKHNSPEQEKIDSLKKIKTEQKRKK